MNPLMQIIGGCNTPNMTSQINQLIKMFSGDGNAAMQMLSQRNPQFAQFIRDNQGKSPEQIAKDYGIDLNAIQGIMR